MTEKTNPTVQIQTNMGNITVELFADKAPRTVENFLNYINKDFFAGTLFHRVIPNFMIQGGGMVEGMQQKPTDAPIKNEADNGLANKRGTIAMARTPDPDSASSQFFINLRDNDFLNYTAPTMQGWGYCVFGAVTEGMDVVDTIAQVETTYRMGHADVPVEDVVIEKVVDL